VGGIGPEQVRWRIEYTVDSRFKQASESTMITLPADTCVSAPKRFVRILALKRAAFLVSTNRFTNHGALRENDAGAGFAVVLFVVIFHGRGCHSRRAIVEVAVAMNTAIAFVIFATAVVVIDTVVIAVIYAIVVVVVIVIAVRCFYCSYPLDFDRCEWKNGVSMLLFCFDCFTLFQTLSFCQ
jgi:hypothetical protein